MKSALSYVCSLIISVLLVLTTICAEASLVANINIKEGKFHSLAYENDLSGKTIYLSVTHGGSRSAGIEREIAATEPNATVIKNMLILNRSDTAKSEQKIKDWAKGL